MMWQVPNGNRLYRSENNTDGHWQDNRAEYFFNASTGRAHIQQWASYGFLGMMFGAGAGSQSHYFDYKGDGITNPPPINGNNLTATYPDDDGGYLRLSIGSYYSTGTIALPSSGSGGTPTAGATSTATRTPTPAVTATRTTTPSARSLIVHVVWEGRPAQPNALQQLPVTLTLKSASTEVNFPSATTDASGFFTVSVASLPNGTYNWRVKGSAVPREWRHHHTGGRAHHKPGRGNAAHRRLQQRQQRQYDRLQHSKA